MLFSPQILFIKLHQRFATFKQQSAKKFIYKPLESPITLKKKY